MTYRPNLRGLTSFMMKDYIRKSTLCSLCFKDFTFLPLTRLLIIFIARN